MTAATYESVESVDSPPGRWRLLGPALFCWALTAVAVAHPSVAAVITTTAAAVGVGTIVSWSIVRFASRSEGSAATHSQRPSRSNAALSFTILSCALLVAVGTSVTTGHTARTSPQLLDAVERQVMFSSEATLEGFPEASASAFGVRHWVRASLQTSAGHVRTLLWLEDQPDSEWAPGRKVSVNGTLQQFEPGRFDAFGMAVSSVESHDSHGLRAELGVRATQLRHGLVAAAEKHPGASLVPGFAVGDTSLVSESLEEAMQESSLSHLVAVSGANCALIIHAVNAVMARVWVGRRLRICASGVALMLFVVIVGPDASVQRAAIMAAVMLIGGFGAKKSVSLPALAVAIVVLLLLDPWQALHPGFALSVAATGGILLFAQPMAVMLQRRLKLPSLLALPVAVAASAQFACGPLLLFLQPGIPAIGIIANVLAAPAAPLGTGLGILSALVLPVNLWFGELLVLVARVAALWVETTAYVTIQLPFARWYWPEGWPGFITLTVCQLLLLTVWLLRSGALELPGGIRVLPRRPWAPSKPAPHVARVVQAALISSAAGLFIGICALAPTVQFLETPRDWVVAACDVGQGDAMLIRDNTLHDSVMLVDTGDDEELLLECLNRFGVEEIALLVLSHDDADHVAALPAILDRVQTAMISPAVMGTVHEERPIVRQLQSARIPTQIGEAHATGHLGPAFGTASWRVLAPQNELPPFTRNGASLVMTVTVGETKILLLGDTGRAEQQLLDALDIGADVVKVAHHGSRDQDPTLASVVQADWALVSVGAGNRHGHPAPETLAQFTQAGSRVLRTDEHGVIAIVPEHDGTLSAWVSGRREE